MNKLRKPHSPREDPPDQREPYKLPPPPSEPDPSEPPSPQQDPPPEEPKRDAAFVEDQQVPDKDSRSRIEQPPCSVVIKMPIGVIMRLPEQEATPRILGDLLEACRESEAGFLRAASRSKKTGLKEFFGTEALQQALFAAELELELKKLGVATKHLTRPRAKLDGWKEIRGTRLLPAGDETVLFLCEWGERAVLGEYLTALQSGLPAEVVELVERQYSQLQEASKRLDQIHEQMRNDERVVEHPDSRTVGPDGTDKDNAEQSAR